ncbi:MULTISPECIES: hypothetical protein [unclassified Mesorhizobium]|uniref:hypothetical protein n=1 Tax=unclassified Mesorhizobium TaxID=325217 RepID=UPI001FDAC245|nr:hypothetical protein [Mesorhizobium sp. LSJC264A00]
MHELRFRRREEIAVGETNAKQHRIAADHGTSRTLSLLPGGGPAAERDEPGLQSGRIPARNRGVGDLALHLCAAFGEVGASIEEAPHRTLRRAPALPLQPLDRRKLAT